MNNNNCCSCNGSCHVKFDDDNGYRYVIDELKRMRNNCDNLIKILENRIEKDNIIDEVLSTDYEDEDKNQEEALKAALAVLRTSSYTDYPFTINKFAYNPYMKYTM